MILLVIRKSLVRTPACEKHPLKRGHISVAHSSEVVTHFGHYIIIVILLFLNFQFMSLTMFNLEFKI